MKSELRLAMLVSGGGTTAQYIIRACQSGELKGICPAVVMSNRKSAGGLVKAQALGASTETIRPFYSCPTALGEEILKLCKKHSVDLIGQYGWLCKTPPNVIEAYQGMIINQHPGPLDFGRPDFGGQGMYGRRVHAARLLFVRAVGYDYWTEACAHRVTAEYDKGAVLCRQAVEIQPDHDPITLQELVLPVEYRVQVKTLADFAAGNVREVMRDKLLVRREDVSLLHNAKETACLLFPRG
ncbi:MAG: formyltransferase family protein [Candidatus Andersenbacteria bacterium]|nr:formyltransferase family protein [bacterium]MDZ4225246.1 formyltransferase family protein [Candidatus Andersenbacteria bacterium]